MKGFLRIMLIFLAAAGVRSVVAAEVWVLDIDGAIGPAVADHVVRGIERATDKGAEAVVLRMDTPGGLDKSMRDIIKAILASPIPVVGYVAPSGARAASAGTYILYASHIAVMAPATNLGAATPVQIGGGGGFPSPSPDSAKPGDHADEPDQDAASAAKTPMEKKVVNDATAYIRSLAELRGRNADWAVQAVVSAATLSADQALAKHVIDLVVEDMPQLLKVLDGREVKMQAGAKTLQTAGATLHPVKPDWRNQFLSVITDPSVAYILLLLGIYGLIFEFSNPGMGAPGIVGAIALLVALYALQVLPVSYSALALIILGIGLMAAEMLSPSFGVLGLGGIAAFLVGSIMLMDTDMPAFQIALPVILALTVVSAGMLFIIFGMLMKSRHRPVVSGLSTLQGRTATVVGVYQGKPMVSLQGERWQVNCSQSLSTGDQVRVIAAVGLTLDVEKMDTEKLNVQ